MGKSRPHVLVVHDDADDLPLIRSELTASHTPEFAVTTVRTLAAARTALLSRSFDIVLTSLELPDSAGLDTLSAVLGDAPTLPVVVLTAVRDELLGLRAVHVGAQDYLSKHDLGTGLLVHCLAFALERQELLRSLALHDELTGLYNRRGLMVLAEKKLAEARRHKKPLFVLYLDVDDFKHINDTWGHAAGDHALVEVARLLQETYRATDIVARLGGDEFAVLGLDSEGSSSAMLADRLRRHLNHWNAQRTARFALSLSTGLRHFNPDEVTLDRALADADAAMYARKHGHHDVA